MMDLRPDREVDLKPRRDRALGDLMYMNREILGYKLLLDRLHGQWAKIVLKNIDPMKPHSYRALIKAFRGAYKSSFFTVGLPLWLLARNPNLRVLVANEVESNAIDFVKEQQGHILRNANFISLFGEWYLRDEFRDSDYIVKTRTRTVGKESSVTAAGLETTLVSGHYDVIIADDLVGPNDRDSEAKRRRTLHFYQDLFSLLETNGVLLVIGTRWHPKDLYDHIENVQNPDLIAQGQRPFDMIEVPGEDESGKPTFPEIRDAESLVRAKIEMGIRSYSAQIRLKPMADEEKIFKKLQFFNPAEYTPGDYARYGYADYSAKKEQDKNDYAAIVDILQTPDGRLLVWGADIKRRAVSETNAALIFKHQVQPYASVGVEDDIFELISEDLQRQILKAGIYIPFKKRATAGLPNKTARINAIEGLITAGIVLFRADWKTAPHNYHLLIEQLEAFGDKKAHDDGPDALEGAIWMCTNKITSETLKAVKIEPSQTSKATDGY